MKKIKFILLIVCLLLIPLVSAEMPVVRLQSLNTSGGGGVGGDFSFSDFQGSFDLNISSWEYNYNQTLVVSQNFQGWFDLNISSWEYNYNQTITYYADEDWINKNETNAFVFNESKLATKYYNATESAIIEGTVTGGDLISTQHTDGNYDGITFNFSEVAGSPGLDLRMNFTGIEDFNGGVMRYKTSSLAGDYPIIQLWNYDESDWEDYPAVSESENFATITQPVFDSTDHVGVGINLGVVQMRIYKSANGNTNNEYYIDWVAISKGYGTPSGEEVDPYSVHRDGSTPLTGNWDVGEFNITLNGLSFGDSNGSIFELEEDMIFRI